MSSTITPTLYPRHLDARIRESLQDTPAVLVNGPRQCGKTTLVRQYAPEMAYFSLDDPTLLAAVQADPLGFVKRLDRAIIDEVQRAPQLLMALKLSIDQNRQPGRFLLTGCANLMTLPNIADSLAGRVEILTLLPLSNAELAKRPSNFLSLAQSQNWSIESNQTSQPTDEVAHILKGGYPEMQHRTSSNRRQAWARAYMTTLIERDIHDIAHIDNPEQIPHLLHIAAEMSGQLINLSQIGGQLHLNGKTVDKYLHILEKLFLVGMLPAWSRNELNRLIKTPKIHFLDAGLQATLTRLIPELAFTQRERFGATLETWVYGELTKMLTLTPETWFLSHYRDKDQVEVDFVLESPMREIIGIEVKSAASVQFQDFKGLIRLRDICKHQFVSGIVLYNGSHALPFGNGLWAVPLCWM